MTEAPLTSGTVLFVCVEAGPCHQLSDILRPDPAISVHYVSETGDVPKIVSETRTDVIICQKDSIAACHSLLYDQAVTEDDDLLLPLLLLLADGISPKEIAEGLAQGADDYIDRSMCEEVLLPKIRSMLDTRRLRRNLWQEERRLAEANSLLERNFRELTSILLKILEVRVPGASDRSVKAKEIADFVAQRMGIHEQKKRQIIFAALLHEIGKIGLPDDLVCKRRNGLAGSSKSVFHQYVTVGSMIISTMTGYREAAEAVHHQLEDFDGSGFPGSLIGEEISLGARILRAIVVYEELDAEGHSPEGIVEHIRSSMHTVLDQDIANLLIEFVLGQDSKEGSKEAKIPVDDLSPGMTIAEDIFAASGVKLLPKGVTLNERTLALLHDRNATDPIIGGVYVLSQGTEEK
jgi:response regulator RpfG family c-di-GMP phosphodiesterase